MNRRLKNRRRKALCLNRHSLQLQVKITHLSTPQAFKRPQMMIKRHSRYLWRRQIRVNLARPSQTRQLEESLLVFCLCSWSYPFLLSVKPTTPLSIQSERSFGLEEAAVSLLKTQTQLTSIAPKVNLGWPRKAGTRCCEAHSEPLCPQKLTPLLENSSGFTSLTLTNREGWVLYPISQLRARTRAMVPFGLRLNPAPVSRWALTAPWDTQRCNSLHTHLRNALTEEWLAVNIS